MNQLTQAIALFAFAITLSLIVASLLKKQKWEQPIPDFIRTQLEEWGIHSIPERYETKEQYRNMQSIVDIIKTKKHSTKMPKNGFAKNDFIIQSSGNLNGIMDVIEEKYKP